MYDLAIIWAWSAWFPAGIYASRYKVKNIIIWELLWWALTQSHLVENYPWYRHISWRDLMNEFQAHAEESWSEILNDRVIEIKKSWDLFRLLTSNRQEIEAKKILVAIWNKYRCLWIKEEKEFIWRWVSYCATCDWMFFKWRDVVVVWWGNTALTETLFLAEICNKVHIVHRRGEFRAENVLIESAKKHENIVFHLGKNVSKIEGGFYIEDIILDDWSKIKADWLFVAIWNEPDTTLLNWLWVVLDEEWYIVVDKRQQTNIDWIYAAWDITTNSNKFKQTLISAAEGALAAASIHEDLLKGD